MLKDASPATSSSSQLAFLAVPMLTRMLTISPLPFSSVERKEDVFLQKLLSLAEIALDAWSKPKGKKLA